MYSSPTARYPLRGSPAATRPSPNMHVDYRAGVINRSPTFHDSRRRLFVRSPSPCGPPHLGRIYRPSHRGIAVPGRWIFWPIHPREYPVSSPLTHRVHPQQSQLHSFSPCPISLKLEVPMLGSPLSTVCDVAVVHSKLCGLGPAPWPSLGFQLTLTSPSFIYHPPITHLK